MNFAFIFYKIFGYLFTYLIINNQTVWSYTIIGLVLVLTEK